MKIAFNIFFLQLIIAGNSIAQEGRTIDSLKSLLKNDNDTAYVNHCLQISTHYSRKNIDSCHAYVNFSIKRCEEKKLNEKLAVALTYSGNFYDLHGDFDKALVNYKQVLNLEEELKNKHGTANAYALLGNTYNHKSELEKALEYHRKSLMIMEEIGDKPGIAMGLGNLGNVALYSGNYSEALKNYLRALPIMQEAGNERHSISILNSVGTIYYIQKNFKSASEYYNKSISSAKKINKPSLATTALYNLGLISTQHYQDYIKGLDYLLKALQMFEEEKDKQGDRKSVV